MGIEQQIQYEVCSGAKVFSKELCFVVFSGLLCCREVCIDTHGKKMKSMTNHNDTCWELYSPNMFSNHQEFCILYAYCMDSIVLDFTMTNIKYCDH